MSAILEMAAIQAVYHRQLNTDRAVRYVTTQTGVNEKQALDALRQVMVASK
jgi:hypothetical protein